MHDMWKQQYFRLLRLTVPRLLHLLQCSLSGKSDHDILALSFHCDTYERNRTILVEFCLVPRLVFVYAGLPSFFTLCSLPLVVKHRNKPRAIRDAGYKNDQGYRLLQKVFHCVCQVGFSFHISATNCWGHFIRVTTC